MILSVDVQSHRQFKQVSSVLDHGGGFKLESNAVKLAHMHASFLPCAGVCLTALLEFAAFVWLLVLYVVCTQEIKWGATPPCMAPLRENQKDEMADSDEV